MRGVIVCIVAAALWPIIIVSAVAAAAQNRLGELWIDPALGGHDTTIPTARTDIGCPDTADGLALTLDGPGFTSYPIPYNLTGDIHGQIHLAFTSSLKDLAAANNTTLHDFDGRDYIITLHCTAQGADVGVFTATLFFDSRFDPPVYMANGSSAEPTPMLLGLTVTPPSPAAEGTVETLTATMPWAFKTSILFEDNGVIIGSPVPAVGTTATLTTTFSPGDHVLVAKLGRFFDVNGSSGSMPVQYTVQPAVTPTPATPEPTAEPTSFLPPPALAGLPPGLWRALLAWLLGQLHALRF